jgi:hydroxyquinol 1,2-dioxygenase
MRNINEKTITQAVTQRMQGMSDERLQTIMRSLVEHLHAFTRETRLTEAEWMQGIEFLTATGQKCDAKRQEFILLSDVLGLSMLTVAMNHDSTPNKTESTVFGPFHVPGAPEYAQWQDISAGAKGQPLFVTAKVLGKDGKPVAGAVVDVWQADEEGLYDVQRPHGKAQARGVLKSDAQGHVCFKTILPVAYPVPTDGPVGRLLNATGRHPWRPAHIHFMIEAEGYETLITHVFRDQDAYLDSDVVFGVRSSLIGQFEAHAAGRAPDGSQQSCEYFSLNFDFTLAPQAAGGGA